MGTHVLEGIVLITELARLQNNSSGGVGRVTKEDSTLSSCRHKEAARPQKGLQGRLNVSNSMQ
jgi:hypothetical protein